MFIEKEKEKVFLTKEESAILERAQEIITMIQDRCESGELYDATENLLSSWDGLFDEEEDYKIMLDSTPKSLVKIYVEID